MVFTYAYELTPFVAGQVTDLFDRLTDTVSCQTPTRFGVVLANSITNPGYVELPSPASLVFAGIAQHEHLDPLLNGAYAGTYTMSAGQIIFPAKYPIPLLRRGRIAAQIDDDLMTVNAGDRVYVRNVADGDNKQPGQIRKDSTGAVLWDKANFTGRIIPGKLAEVAILLS